MISEYALDPELVAQWHDPKEWAFYREAFADGTGRVGSTFPRQNPKKWRQHVLATFRQRVPGATAESSAWRQMEGLLERLSERMVERDAYDGGPVSWLASALSEHRDRPFHGILSAASAAGVSEVITPAALFAERPPAAWLVAPCPTVPRTAVGFANALRPLLTRCREAVFVDPHFDPGVRRFREPLQAMLEVLWGAGRCVHAPAAQLVVAEKKLEAPVFISACREWLPRTIPKGRSVTVTVLRERQGGEKIHNRYVLTKFAGVSFGTGLDVASSSESSQTDDLCRLSWEQLKDRWGQYVSARGSYFDAVEKIVIPGVR